MSLLSVMIVDDSEADQFISKFLLEKYDPNVEVLQAYDGQEALDVLDSVEQQPTVIFLDINMPRMNGLEFLAAYDKRGENGSSIVVMLTSSDHKKDVDASMSYKSVKEYLTKPLGVEYLERILN